MKLDGFAQEHKVLNVEAYRFCLTGNGKEGGSRGRDDVRVSERRHYCTRETRQTSEDVEDVKDEIEDEGALVAVLFDAI